MADDIEKLMRFVLHEGEGRCTLSLILIDTGAGIQGLLTGGEKPHIGGSVLALPRPSLTGDGQGADLFVIPVPSHKDVDVAGPMAERLARMLNQPVALSAGIHCDGLTGAELSEVRFSVEKLGEEAVKLLSRK